MTAIEPGRMNHGVNNSATRLVATTVLIRDPRRPEQFLIQPRRPWTRLMIAVRVSSLDRLLAAGFSPESTMLLAARAQDLVSPASREKLCRNWENVVIKASRPMTRRDPYAPFRDRVAEATPEIGRLVAALSLPLVPTVQGVAMAELLLTDGAGPLYASGGARSLVTALRDATARLDQLTTPLQ